MSRIIIVPRGSDGNEAKLKADLPNDYSELAERAEATIHELTALYPRTARLYQFLIDDARLGAHWNLSNYTTVSKLSYNDHGPIHARVVTSYAMEITTLLMSANVPMDVINSGVGGPDEVFLVTLAGIMLHDIGNSVHRLNHELVGMQLAHPILDSYLPQLYPDQEQRQLIEDFILSAILCHDVNPAPLFMECAVVAVADGCDMTKGRARMPFDLGKVDIHAVSALAIEEVNIRRGASMPVEIAVLMSNSAGIFQVEQTLVRKLLVTPLRKYVTVAASTVNPDDPCDKRIIHSVELRDGRLSPTNW
ncbi:MAG: phosphohydrolase [Chloroflexi bacterium]|nr:phosphohydrolase [Chloroflexota bacterium]MCL5274715.1 phosphohydrolase [Chloroflexota bacterium]